MTTIRKSSCTTVPSPRVDGHPAHAGTACRSIAGGLALLCLLFCTTAAAAEPADVDAQLKQADQLRTADPTEFAALLARLESQASRLTTPQRQYFRYLKAWQSAYAGDYETAIPALKSIIDESNDVNLQFRAGATVANMMVVATRYEEAFTQLNQLLALLPRVTDRTAREQGLSVIAYLYSQVGEYELGLSYAEKQIAESAGGRGACSGAQTKLEALYRSTKLRTVGQEFQSGIDICVEHGETIYANAIRTYVARVQMDQGRFDDAINLLQQHYAEIQRTQYRRLLVEFDALLAMGYRQTGDSAKAQRYALNAVQSVRPNQQYTEPLVQAYRLLYLLAKESGDTAAALNYHEKYATADKGYLDDVSARQLAYERVKHETTASKLQIEALNSENRLLQLQRENNRLYIALLIMILGFIAFWAYKTKRSQLHFKKLAEQDGLTGIANRPHFIELSENALEASRRSQQQVCAVLCDLDHFKAINDKHGHAMGDYVLKQVVASCRSHLRSADVFGRFGGEEFGILLPDCNLDTARQLCERLRIAIAGVANLKDDLESSVSASFGIATTDAFGYELRQLLAHADAALYQAKHAGRNRVVAYDAVDFAELSAVPRTRPVRASRTI